MEGFVYVVNPPIIPRVVFGTSLERETLPLSGPCVSPFMRQNQGDLFLSPGPAASVDETDYLQLNWPSIQGHSAFASRLSRLPPTQVSSASHVGYYELDPPRLFKKAHKPFNVGALRKDKEGFLTPAPATYPFHLQRKKLKISTAFGTKRKVFNAFKVICTPFNVAKCKKCKQTPKADYWHDFKKKVDICRPCMKKIEKHVRSCTASELKRIRMRREFMKYELVRYCDFYHDHGGTVAAVQTMPTADYKLKMKTENYLSLFMPNVYRK